MPASVKRQSNNVTELVEKYFDVMRVLLQKPDAVWEYIYRVKGSRNPKHDNVIEDDE